ncbi:hypothetical protein MASSI9I_50137 [Massilia sp. 9I]|nr:hypothetical protein MASSI9I_50137 [Massilia sp. 9I]
MIGSLVRGSRPVRAARSPTVKVPKPTSVTLSLFFSDSVTALIIASRARVAEALVMSADFAISSISSVLFTLTLVYTLDAAAPFLQKCKGVLNKGNIGLSSNIHGGWDQVACMRQFKVPTQGEKKRAPEGARPINHLMISA